MSLEKLHENPIYILNLKVSIFKYYIFLIVIIILFSFLLFYPYNNYLNYILYIDNDYKLIVDDNFFPIEDKIIYINHKKYFYSVKNISEQKIIDNKVYYEVVIDIDIKDYDKNIIKVKVLKDKTTIFKKIIFNMKGWLNE